MNTFQQGWGRKGHALPPSSVPLDFAGIKKRPEAERYYVWSLQILNILPSLSFWIKLVAVKENEEKLFKSY